MVASISGRPAIRTGSDRGDECVDSHDLRVLFRRPELCVADARGVVILLLLTALRTEWLEQLFDAQREAALRHGSPRPFIALCKLDKRFPVDIGFDQNIGELRRVLERSRPHIQAGAVIVDFDGMLGFTMRHALRLLGIFAGGDPPMHVCSTAAEAVCWIEQHRPPDAAGTFEPSYYLQAIRALETLLGSVD